MSDTTIELICESCGKEHRKDIVEIADSRTLCHYVCVPCKKKYGWKSATKKRTWVEQSRIWIDRHAGSANAVQPDPSET